MVFVTIDGDDIGRTITSSYLRNDIKGLSDINKLVSEKTGEISVFMESIGFTVIFRAADGVAAFSTSLTKTESVIFEEIERIAKNELSFSAGFGTTLRESYLALLLAKSNGKACYQTFKDLGGDA